MQIHSIVRPFNSLPRKPTLASQFYDSEAFGELDTSVFSLLHGDLLSHKYSNVHKDTRKCFKEIANYQVARMPGRVGSSTDKGDRDAARPSTSPRTIAFNRFIRWLISTESFSDGLADVPRPTTK